MRLITLASGSSGNCALLREGRSNLLIDAGISLRRIRAGLARQGLSPGELDAVLVTHEHSDHTAGLAMLVKHHGVPVLAPRTVARHLLWSCPALEDALRVIPKGESFPVKKFSVRAFSTSHDTEESVGYIIEAKGRLGFCTDTGCVTEEMLSALRGCDAALIEANHDVEMLSYGPYPAALKRRILSERGHLSNESCGALACALAEAGTGTLVLGHLSRENNTPRRAVDTVSAALAQGGYGHVKLLVAPADADLELEIEPCCGCV